MISFIDSDNWGDRIEQHTYNRLLAGENVCVVGKTRKSINTNFLNNGAVKQVRFSIDPQEHVYVFFGHYWRAMTGDKKSLKKEFWRAFRTDGMKGAGHDLAVQALRAHRRFYYFTKHSKCGIFEFEKSLLVDTITNATPERADVLFAPHVTTIMNNAAESKTRVWSHVT